MVAVLSATLVLQLPQQMGITPGDAIQGGFSLVVLGLVWMVYRRQDQREKAASESTKELHGRIDQLIQDQTTRAEQAAERYGRMAERADVMREDLIGISARIDGVGSRISNQVERSFESRQTEVDRRFEELRRDIGELRRSPA